MSLGELTGHWSAVEGHGEAAERAARAIEQAIVHLHAIRDEDETVARAMARVREAAGEVATQIGRATSRFEVTGTALVEYAGQLRVAQARAEEAADDWDAADARLRAAAAERDRLDALGATDAVAEQRSSVELHAAVRAEAEAAWRAASEHKERAAELAEARILAEIEGAAINDSLWDDVRGAVAACVRAIEDALVEALAWLGAAIVAAIALVVAAALAVALAASGLVGLLLAGLALLAIATWLSSGGSAAFVRILARTGSLEAALVGGAIAWLRGALPWLAEWLVQGDAGEPVLVWHGALEPERGAAGTPGDHLARLQADNRAADAHAGGPGSDPEASTMVRVTAVTGAEGTTVYRVHVPSTQQWLPGGSAVNDVHAGVAAKLGSGPTQLELAVRQSMAAAGVPEGASVLLAGWSLGGIAAAALAADPAFAEAYDVDAVIVAGASIDDIPVPGHIPVLSFEHAAGAAGIGDPVPLTEDPTKPSLADEGHRTVVRVAPPALAGPVPHHGLAYQLSMQEQGDAPGSHAHTWMALHDLERYFVGLEQPHASIHERGQ